MLQINPPAHLPDGSERWAKKLEQEAHAWKEQRLRRHTGRVLDKRVVTWIPKLRDGAHSQIVRHRRAET